MNAIHSLAVSLFMVSGIMTNDKNNNQRSDYRSSHPLFHVTPSRGDLIMIKSPLDF